MDLVGEGKLGFDSHDYRVVVRRVGREFALLELGLQVLSQLLFEELVEARRAQVRARRSIHFRIGEETTTHASKLCTCVCLNTY